MEPLVEHQNRQIPGRPTGDGHVVLALCVVLGWHVAFLEVGAVVYAGCLALEADVLACDAPVDVCVHERMFVIDEDMVLSADLEPCLLGEPLGDVFLKVASLAHCLVVLSLRHQAELVCIDRQRGAPLAQPEDCGGIAASIHSFSIRASWPCL
jgi:hypothetical protein